MGSSAGSDCSGVDRHRRRRRDLRGLLRRQDVAALGDDDSRADARRWSHRRRAHRGDAVDVDPVVPVLAVLSRSSASPASGRRPVRPGDEAALASEFNICLLNLLPLVILIILSLRRAPPFAAILTSAPVRGGDRLVHPAARHRRVRGPGGLAGHASRRSTWRWPRVRQPDRQRTIDSLFSRGGMSSMLFTIWLVLGALSFAAIMRGRRVPGAPHRARREGRASRRGALIVAVIFTAIGLNIIAGDQYVADRHAQPRLPLAFRRRGSRRGCCRGPSRTPGR